MPDPFFCCHLRGIDDRSVVHHINSHRSAKTSSSACVATIDLLSVHCNGRGGRACGDSRPNDIVQSIVSECFCCISFSTSFGTCLPAYLAVGKTEDKRNEKETVPGSDWSFSSLHHSHSTDRRTDQAQRLLHPRGDFSSTRGYDRLGSGAPGYKQTAQGRLAGRVSLADEALEGGAGGPGRL